MCSTIFFPNSERLDLADVIHEMSKVVGDPLGADEAIHTFYNGTDTGRAASARRRG